MCYVNHRNSQSHRILGEILLCSTIILILRISTIGAQSFTEIPVNIKPVSASHAAWGDYDNDGDFDLVVIGDSSQLVLNEYYSTVYRNDGGDFVNINAPLINVASGSVAWGDYDNDGDLDFFITGIDYKTGNRAYLYRNDIDKENKPPSYPENLQVKWEKEDLAFSWDKAIDQETKQDALTYNIRIASESGGQNIVSPMANLNTGKLLKPQFGNVSDNKRWMIKNINAVKIYWSVQTIDNGFSASEFAPEQVFDPSLITGYQTYHLNFELFQNFPNPFNPTTTISYTIKNKGQVELSIYDLQGQKVGTLVHQIQSVGKHSVKLDCSKWSSGILFFD